MNQSVRKDFVQFHRPTERTIRKVVKKIKDEDRVSHLLY